MQVLVKMNFFQRNLLFTIYLPFCGEHYISMSFRVCQRCIDGHHHKMLMKFWFAMGQKLTERLLFCYRTASANVQNHIFDKFRQKYGLFVHCKYSPMANSINSYHQEVLCLWHLWRKYLTSHSFKFVET